MKDCQCGLPPEMALAGAAAQLCNHSSLEEAQKVQEQLIELLDGLADNIPAEELFSKPLSEVAETYMRKVVGNDYHLMYQQEHNILMVSFLRQVSLGVQALQAGMVLRLQESGRAGDNRPPQPG